MIMFPINTGIVHNLYYFVTPLLPSLKVTVLHFEERGVRVVFLVVLFVFKHKLQGQMNPNFI